MNPSLPPHATNFPLQIRAPNFPFHAQNPDPNPNFFPQSHPQNPQPFDLLATLSSLNHLISLSHQTLNSLSSLSLKPQNDDNYVPCPFNPHHRMPPERLFLHSLHCPHPISIDPTSIINSLHYPTTLKRQNQESHSLPSIQDPTTELCFSLDDYYFNFGSNVCYGDCPGVVVILSKNDLDGAKRKFSLPGVLLPGCSDFVGSTECVTEGVEKGGFRILASELCSIRREVEGWTDYPSAYSYGVICAILGLKIVREGDLRRWVIVNSPRYGVVIDVFMRDHISVIFRLCLRAIMKEAFGLANLAVNSRNLNYQCPVLVQVLMWFATQLAVLYGEMNGKLYAISMLKHCILATAPELLFPYEEGDTRNIKIEKLIDSISECQSETVDDGVIGVSQVTAAVAALHERSLLEEKIRALRSQPLTAYQRMAKHACLSSRADEERKKRPNYRPIIEHDGLPRNYSSNQETSKTKTREELLAEERDYKRRRMSYRGKKLKRTTLQVMRDIIEEYTEEIKQAGGIGCFEKESEEQGMLPKPVPNHDLNIELRKSTSESSEATRGSPNLYRKQSHPDYDTRSITFVDASSKHYERRRQGLHGYPDPLEDGRRNNGREKHSRDYYPDSTEKYTSHGQSPERTSRLRKRDDLEVSRTKIHEIKRLSSGMSGDLDYKSIKNDKKLEIEESRRRNKFDYYSSDYLNQNAFEDRYDPSESRDMYEDDPSTGSKYSKPE